MSGKIPQEFIDDLLQRIDIVEVISKHVALKKTGSEYKACCPFHSEKSPSFSVSQRKQFYYCFGCHAQGNAISFLIDHKGMHFVDAVETLASETGIEVPRQKFKGQSTTHSLYRIMNLVTAQNEKNIAEASHVMSYLASMGITESTIRKFSIGYSQPDDQALLKSFPDCKADLIDSGLCTLAPTDASNAPCGTRFHDRLMIPIKDRRGRVVAFAGQSISDAEPKYLCTLPTRIYSNSPSQIFGLYEAYKAAQRTQRVIALNDYIPVLSLSEAGVDNAVAIHPTPINQELSEALYQIAPTIVYVFPDTGSGRASAWLSLKSTLPCLSDGRDAVYVMIPEPHMSDPGKLVEALSMGIPIIDMLYQFLSNNPFDKQSIPENAATYIDTMPAGVYRSLSTRRIARLHHQKEESFSHSNQ